MKKNGFTLIELVTTFALASVLIIILINVVLLIKDIYSKNNLESQLIIEKSNLSYLINNRLYNGLKSYNACDKSDFCYSFNFNDGTSDELIVTEKSIRFGNYVYKLDDGLSIEAPLVDKIQMEVSATNVDNSFLIIKIPIKHKLYPDKDYGINIVYQYNSNEFPL